MPFEWTIRLLPHWLTMITTLLVIFYAWDRCRFRSERTTRDAATRAGVEIGNRLRIEGGVNIILLLGVLTVAFVIRDSAPRSVFSPSMRARGGR
ncbi:MAG: sodium:proton antiporter [Candidatus Methylomirabilis sp.]|nr:sodium:proton antiporter [Candidatus Methylomirabilis sp.]